MIITIDGPAGSGKSTLSKEFAKHIKFNTLDTGAMYRSVALLVKEQHISLDDSKIEGFLETLLENINISFQGEKVFLNEKEVTKAIRTPEIDLLTSKVSLSPIVRSKMKDMQRMVGNGNTNIVAEGRDMGSNVFPDAKLKFYLTASPEVRAERRYKQLLEQGIDKNLEKLTEEIIQRDKEDSERKLNPLVIPQNAVLIDTSHLNSSEVLSEMIRIYEIN